jgi:SAM-dependent methyltransferase
MENSLQSLLPLLACPHDRTGLQLTEAWFAASKDTDFLSSRMSPFYSRRCPPDNRSSPQHRCILLPSRGRTKRRPVLCGFARGCRRTSAASCRWRSQRNDVRSILSFPISVGATNGNLYQHLIGSLPDYPIPTSAHAFRPRGSACFDLGCSWGRWSIAAARKGYDPVGLDPSLGAVLAAQRLSVRLGVPFIGVVGDARYLPFKAEVFDAVYSYSVLQHFSKQDTRNALHEIRRTLRDRGRFGIQMASAWGVRSFQLQVRRRFRQPSSFEVRYWSPLELSRTFREIFGLVRMSVDCYFGLGLQAADIRFMSPTRRYSHIRLRVVEGRRGLVSPSCLRGR